MWVALYEIPLNLDAYIDKKLLHSEDYEVGHIVSFYIAYYAYKEMRLLWKTHGNTNYVALTRLSNWILKPFIYQMCDVLLNYHMNFVNI